MKFKQLLFFTYKYVSDESFRKLCDNALSFSKSIDRAVDIYGAKPKEARSSQWPKVRDLHLKNNPVCSVCGGKEDLTVHHIIPFHVDKSKELDSKNLITLCESRGCHFSFGHFFNWQNYNPDVINDSTIFKKKVEQRK